MVPTAVLDCKDHVVLAILLSFLLLWNKNVPPHAEKLTEICVHLVPSENQFLK